MGFRPHTLDAAYSLLAELYHDQTNVTFLYNEYIFIFKNIDIHFISVDGIPEILDLFSGILYPLDQKSFLQQGFLFILFDSENNIAPLVFAKAE